MTGNIHQNYNARDVINAPEVKTAILQRSLFRQIMRPSKNGYSTIFIDG